MWLTIATATTKQVTRRGIHIRYISAVSWLYMTKNKDQRRPLSPICAERTNRRVVGMVR